MNDKEQILEALRKTYRVANRAMQLVELLTKRLEVKGVLDIIEDRTSEGHTIPFTDAKEEAQKKVDEMWKHLAGETQ